jgi:hypothetical protein
MVIKYTNSVHAQALQNLPKLVFLVWKQTIWQPWRRLENCPPVGCRVRRGVADNKISAADLVLQTGAKIKRGRFDNANFWLICLLGPVFNWEILSSKLTRFYLENSSSQNWPVFTWKIYLLKIDKFLPKKFIFSKLTSFYLEILSWEAKWNIKSRSWSWKNILLIYNIFKAQCPEAWEKDRMIIFLNKSFWNPINYH